MTNLPGWQMPAPPAVPARTACGQSLPTTPQSAPRHRWHRLPPKPPETLPALEQSARDAAAQLEETKQDLADTVKYRQTLEENEKQLGNIRSGLELKLRSRKAALDEADTAEQRLGRELDAARQRLSVLRELEKNMDGYQNSVRAVMRAAGARRLRGVLGPVSTILKVEPGCEVAIETALGGALQNIVVENEAAAKAAIALLRNDHAGRATFLPLDTVQPGVFRGRLSGTARLASALVQADPRYENIVSNLLGRIIVVEDINEASRVARDNGYHNKVVTMDGQVINAGGSFTGGSVQRSAGLFTRKQEMEELRLKAAKLQKDCLAAQEKTDQCKEQADALQAELTATASEQITAANDRVRAEAEQKRLEAAAAQLETAVQNAQQQMDALQAALNDSRAKADAAALQQAELTAQIEQLTAELSRIAEGSDSFLTQQNQLAQALSAKRLEQAARMRSWLTARSLRWNSVPRTPLTAAPRWKKALPPLLPAAKPAAPRSQPSARPRPTARPPLPKRSRPSAKLLKSGLPASRRKRKHWQKPAPPPTAARRWAGRWHALPSVRPLPRPSTTRPWQSCGTSTSSQSVRRSSCAWSSTA